MERKWISYLDSGPIPRMPYYVDADVPKSEILLTGILDKRVLNLHIDTKLCSHSL
jgi:hypothetical protein